MGWLDKRLQGAVQTALRVIYPARCLSCGGQVESDFGLCAGCWAETPFLGGTVCDSCGAPLPGGPDAQAARCDQCLADPPPWTRGRAAMMYEGMGRRLVMGLKHGDRHDIAAPAADWLLESAGPLIRSGMIVAPVPLHWRRMMSRGYNQSALLSRHLAARLAAQGARDLPDLLVRRRATPGLDHRSRAERHMLLEGTMAVDRRHLEVLRGRPVLLVDDVLTSGATFSEATRACVAAGSGPVSVLALARVAKAP
ncbi:ComF family protein [Pseudooceanicola sp. CBS1P-1]|uniref:ComF family protein n=1 Tax=Pseudooceanicola albus TaxID=2692189 RepID=A0A6L7G2A3_9RHOB|nr:MULTISPECIES: ComF family protein [Pseudooceanicola]MBT9383873.1 ComF family protein [Pseudooceanicola endophyticus]MXN16713.1 ComF family protein [Pseudooceanicola albus]